MQPNSTLLAASMWNQTIAMLTGYRRYSFRTSPEHQQTSVEIYEVQTRDSCGTNIR